MKEMTAAGGLPVVTRRLVHVYAAGGLDVAALAAVDLVVDAGEYVGLLGPSGAGKSTLINLLGGLFRPTAGQVLVGDTDLAAAEERTLDTLRAGPIAVLVQGAARNLLLDRSPRGNVVFAQRRARARDRAVPSVDDVLRMTGLDARADDALDSLSPGELQLTALAVALAPGPGLLLADEPTSQLHHTARDEVLDVLRRVNSAWRTTIVLVTHDPAVAGSLPRTVTIRDGRIGGEGRRGEEFAVVTADGFLPLPAAVLDALPPGTLVQLEGADDGYRLSAVDDEGPASG